MMKVSISETSVYFSEITLPYILEGSHLYISKKSKVVPLHAMEALGGGGGIAPTHSRPRH
jgi:hypothetical protein